MSNEAAGNTPGTDSNNNPSIANFFDNMSTDGPSTGAPKAPVTETAPVTTPATTTTTEVKPVPAAGAATTVTTGAPGTAPLPPQGTLQLTTQQIEALVTGAVRAGAPAAPEPEIKQPTKEEQDAKFGVVYPTEAEINTVFRGGPEGVASLQSLLHRTAQMGALTASHHLIAELEKLQGYVNKRFDSLGPIRERAAATEMQEHTSLFFKAFPHWKEEQVPLLKGVYDKLLAQKFNADGKLPADAVYAKVNEEALLLARAVNPQFAVAAQGSGTPQNGAGNPSPGAQQSALPQSHMTPLPTGGAGGSGAASGSSPGAKTGPEALFG